MSAPTVLVIDDNPASVELVSFILEAAAFKVEAAAGADEAMRKIRASRPDLILMDIQLPGMNGLSLTRQLKTDGHTRGIAIVAFTAYAMKGDEENMLAAGCDGYLSKPINVATFADQVRGCLMRAAGPAV
jgi:two-component system cell cycle response regulator DivK